MSIRTVSLISALLLALASLAPAQGTAQGRAQQPDTRPLPSVGNNRSKSDKDTNTRVIEGMVHDAAGNPIPDAIVQLKDTKTSKIVDFSTKSDGKFTFRDLPMDINYELVAKLGDAAAPTKKVSVYDTRKDVVVNFQLAPAKAQH